MSSFVFTLLGLAITGSPLLVFGALLGVGAVLLTASKPIRTIPLLSDVEAA